MSVILVLIGVSVSVALCFVGAFVWAVRSGQFDDPVAPSVRILLEDNTSSHPSQKRNHEPRQA